MRLSTRSDSLQHWWDVAVAQLPAWGQHADTNAPTQYLCWSAGCNTVCVYDRKMACILFLLHMGHEAGKPLGVTLRLEFVVHNTALFQVPTHEGLVPEYIQGACVTWARSFSSPGAVHFALLSLCRAQRLVHTPHALSHTPFRIPSPLINHPARLLHKAVPHNFPSHLC